MSLFLVRLEHEDQKVTCCLVRAAVPHLAHAHVNRWLGVDCVKMDKDVYLDLEENRILRIAGISEIESVNDLEKYLPLIDGLLPQDTGAATGQNHQ